MILYKWIYTSEEAGAIWYFIYHDGEKFLGWKYNYKDLNFYDNGIKIGNSKNWFYSRIPKYLKNNFVEKKGWRNFTKKKGKEVKKKMILDIFETKG